MFESFSEVPLTCSGTNTCTTERITGSAGSSANKHKLTPFATKNTAGLLTLGLLRRGPSPLSESPLQLSLITRV